LGLRETGVNPSVARSTARLQDLVSTGRLTPARGEDETGEPNASSWSLGADFGVSEAASDESDVTDVVEPAGHFRIYLGSAAGVGKTFAMLDEGHRRHNRGTDVVIGFVECHKRPHTEERIDDLELVARKVVDYRGTQFEELDLEAILTRRPKLALIDELAHTNVPGSGRNEKRWQDVLELLEAGVDVITTVNIQHLESIADAVEQITGVQVRERVPDWVVRKADQIELVDSSPEQLRRRMLHGNIYAPNKVPQALTHFFRTDNLIALREVALRFLADESEEELLEHLRRRNASVVWETTERIMVGVTGAPGTEAVVRRAARLASRIKAELHVVHVASGDVAAPSRDSMAKLHELASAVGAQWHELQADHPADGLLEFARQEQITQIVLGSSQRSRWQELLGGGSVVRRIQRMAGSAGIDVHTIAKRELPPELQVDTQSVEASDEGWISR
jgi:two-component system sensor histidine kinase KdpD